MEGKVLFVSTVDPFGKGGGPQATRAYLDATIDIFGSENLTIVVPDDTIILKEYCDIEFVKIPQRSKISIILGLFRGITGRFSKAVFDILKKSQDNYSWCIFNGGLEAGWTFSKLPQNQQLIKVTIHHNQEVEYYMDNKAIFTLGGRFPYLVRIEEKNAYKYSDINLFLTNQDKSAFSKMYGHTKAFNDLIGTFDYKSAEVIKISESSKQYDIVASGSLLQYQTVHGIFDYFNNYYEISKEVIPNIKVLLTGRSPKKEILDLQKENEIDIVASPIDIQSEVLKGRIFLCPTDIGGGLKLRAMDGLKNGLPILIHEVSSRGYDFFFDKPYFRIYKDKASFEKGLKGILYYLQENPFCAETINSDFYNYFGYQKGVERIKHAFTTFLSVKTL